MSGSKAEGFILVDRPLDFSGLPTATPGHGYVYAIEFTNAVVKVGKTTCPRRRMSQHRSEVKLHGHDMAGLWMSPAHADLDSSEARLIEYGHRHGASVGPRLEYFEGLDFGELVTFARGMEFEPCDPEGGKMPLVEVKALQDGAHAHMAAYMVDSGDRELIDCAREFYVGMAFGRSFFNKYDLPVDIASADSVDALEQAVIAMVRIEADRLRSHLSATDDHLDVGLRKILEGS